jgi:hypothetical protein
VEGKLVDCTSKKKRIREIGTPWMYLCGSNIIILLEDLCLG